VDKSDSYVNHDIPSALIAFRSILDSRAFFHSSKQSRTMGNLLCFKSKTKENYLYWSMRLTVFTNLNEYLYRQIMKLFAINASPPWDVFPRLFSKCFGVSAPSYWTRKFFVPLRCTNAFFFFLIVKLKGELFSEECGYLPNQQRIKRWTYYIPKQQYRRGVGPSKLAGEVDSRHDRSDYYRTDIVS